jgi:hypothetical protein
MDFYEITEDLKVSSGEYILHKPSNSLVLCGSFKRNENKIRVLGATGMFEDIIDNFNKIKLDKKDGQNRNISGCKGCRGK